MAEKVIKTTFQLRRGNSDTYTRKNIKLKAGEPAFELDTGRLKIGDGETPWNNLAYINDKEFVYKPGGSIEEFRDLPALEDSNIGYVYNIREGFITTEHFIEGAGKYYSAGTDVTIIKIGEDLWYNIYGGFVDLSDYATKDELNSKQSSLNPQKGILIDNENKIKLEEPFYDYLVKQTFKKPTIAYFDITNLGGAAEIGTSVQVSGFTHRETNISNFDGTLTLKKGNIGLAENIAPDDTVNPMASGSFPIQTVTSNVVDTVTFTLSGTYTVPGTNEQSESVSKSVSKTFYVPKIYGILENNIMTEEELKEALEDRTCMTYVSSYGSKTEISLLTEGYIFFAATGEITQITDTSTGFSVGFYAFENNPVALSINGVNVDYNVYYTDKLIPQPDKPFELNIKVS